MALNGYGSVVDDSPKADTVSNSELIKALSPEDEQTKEWLAESARRMAGAAKTYLELEKYDSAAMCAMRADALQWASQYLKRGA